LRWIMVRETRVVRLRLGRQELFHPLRLLP
jgi:hypothetical protein